MKNFLTLCFALITFAAAAVSTPPPIVRNHYTINNTPSIFDATGSMLSEWQLTKKLFITNASYDIGGLRVSTCYFDKQYIRLYYAGYQNPILSGGGANSAGDIIGVFGKTWDSLSKYGVVLSRGAGGTWDSGNIGGARVYNFGTATNYMYYFAGQSTSFESGLQETGVAYSTNGTNWVKYSGNPILTAGAANSWEDRAVQGAVCVIKHGEVYYMFYGGMQNNASIYGGALDENIGLAFATSPLGPWTKYSGNPVLTNGANILAEPNVFRLPDGNWGMILGQGAAWSSDLTNWTMLGTITVSDPRWGAGVPGFPGAILSPFVFNDNGPTALYDDTTAIYMAKPKQSPTDLRADREQSISFASINVNGTGLSKATYTAQLPSPFFTCDGLNQTAANQVAVMLPPVPSWCTNAIIRLCFYSPYAGVVAWTNSLTWIEYPSAGRIIHNSTSTPGDGKPAIRDVTVITANATEVWSTNAIPMTTTTAPKEVILQMNASSNSSARYVIGPLYIRYEGSEP